MIIIDGLMKAGKEKLAKEMALKYCHLVEEKGFYENFNVMSGKGLRDSSYTWTSSVYLVLNKLFREV